MQQTFAYKLTVKNDQNKNHQNDTISYFYPKEYRSDTTKISLRGMYIKEMWGNHLGRTKNQRNKSL